MKTRIISAIILLALLIPITIHGGIIFNVVAYFAGVLGLKELLDCKSKERPVPFPISLFSYLFLTLIILVDVTSSSIVYSLDYRILAALFIIFLGFVVLYHDKNKYSVVDAFYMIGSVLFLGICMALLIMLRAFSLKLFVFLLIITFVTDTFSYISNYLIGKHKVFEKVTKSKSIEGMVIGTIMGVFVSFMFYITCIDSSVSVLLLLFVCTCLSLFGQLGDLFFSCIKRYFKINEFSNLIPGHGGILDRLNSIIFVLLGFTFFMTLI